MGEVGGRRIDGFDLPAADVGLVTELDAVPFALRARIERGWPTLHPGEPA